MVLVSGYFYPWMDPGGWVGGPDTPSEQLKWLWVSLEMSIRPNPIEKQLDPEPIVLEGGPYGRLSNTMLT